METEDNNNKTIAQGAQGKIIFKINPETKERRAVKLYEQTEDFVRERKVYSVIKDLIAANLEAYNLKWDPFLKTFEVNEEKQSIEFDLYPSNLRTFCLRKHGLLLTESTVLFFQICLALKSFHSISLAHRDLKFDNILIYTDRNDRFLKIKMIDFGHSQVFNGQNMHQDICGTEGYLPIRLLRSFKIGKPKKYNPFKLDIFGLGLLFLNMIFPVPNDDAIKLIKEDNQNEFWKYYETSYKYFFKKDNKQIETSKKDEAVIEHLNETKKFIWKLLTERFESIDEVLEDQFVKEMGVNALDFVLNGFKQPTKEENQPSSMEVEQISNPTHTIHTQQEESNNRCGEFVHVDVQIHDFNSKLEENCSNPDSFKQELEAFCQKTRRTISEQEIQLDDFQTNMSIEYCVLLILGFILENPSTSEYLYSQQKFDSILQSAKEAKSGALFVFQVKQEVQQTFKYIVDSDSDDDDEESNEYDSSNKNEPEDEAVVIDHTVQVEFFEVKEEGESDESASETAKTFIRFSHLNPKPNMFIELFVNNIIQEISKY